MKNLIVAMALMTLLSSTSPAEAMPKPVRIGLRIVTYVPAIVIGFKVGVFVGMISGAVAGTLVGEKVWADYFNEKDLEAAQAAKAKAAAAAPVAPLVPALK